jgi:hypothetical protein
VNEASVKLGPCPNGKAFLKSIADPREIPRFFDSD